MEENKGVRVSTKPLGAATVAAASRSGIVERVFLRPLDAAAMLSIGRSKIYELISRGEVPSVVIAGMIRIPRAAIERLAAEAMQR